MLLTEGNQMTNENKRHTGARKLEFATGPDPRDDFSQEAAKNRKPPLGMGLAEKLDEQPEPTRKSDGLGQMGQDQSSPAKK